MKPNYLNKNSIIYFVAPSFGEFISPYFERFNKSQENLSKLGHKLVIGPNCYKNDGVAASASPEARGKEFMDAYKSNADAIISVGGGETMCEMLSFVDFEEIKKQKPKWFVGFSDNTNLTYTLATICDIETIYGTGGAGYYSYPFQYDAKDTYDMLNGRKIFYGYEGWCPTNDNSSFPEYNLTVPKIISSINYKEPFEGILLGGCLDILVTISGTKFDNTVNYINNKKEKIIFFMEACDLNAVGIRRALWQLKNTGWFDKNIAGFIIGRSLHYDDNSFGTTPMNSYIDLLSEYNAPILLNVDLGHLDPSMPIRCGAKAKVSLENENIKIEYNE